MKKTVFLYYLVPFVLLFIVLVINALSGRSVNSTAENIFIAFVFALAGSLIIGTVSYLYDTRWGPHKRKKILSKSPFVELKERGFRQYDDFVWGVVNGYTVFVSFDWPAGRTAINIEVLFDPRRARGFITSEELKEMKKRNKTSDIFSGKEYVWDRNAIGYSMEYTFTPPSHEKVLTKAKELTEILVTENLKPISKEEAQKLLPELKAWLNANRGEQSKSL